MTAEGKFPLTNNTIWQNSKIHWQRAQLATVLLWEYPSCSPSLLFPSKAFLEITLSDGGHFL